MQQVKGVSSAVSGYMGGRTKDPSYDDICTGSTGHAEVVQVKFDPTVVSTTELLHVFFKAHDPTTLNRQGADVGTQYRSAIFYETDEQRAAALAVIAELDDSRTFTSKIVTEVTKASTFYPAEDYHQKYYFSNPGQGYCRAVIRPKLAKLGLKH